MRFRSTKIVLCVAVTVVLPVRANAQDEHEPEREWRHRALLHINRIQNEEVLGQALFEFNRVRLRAGDIEGASADAPRISNPQLCGYAHYEIARYRKALGDFSGAVAEVHAARASAVSRGFAFEHVDACLDIAESLDMAKSYVSSVQGPNSTRSSYGHSVLVGALAKRGFLKQALQIVDRQPEKRGPLFLSRIAQATAKRADIANTEKLLERITTDKSRDAVYVDLIRALSQRGHMDKAKKFVGRIKDPVARHNAERMTGSVGGKPVDKVSIDDLQKHVSTEKSPEVRQQLNHSILALQLQKKDVAGAEATIEAMVELIRTSNLKKTKSKFGNTTDESRIALIEVNYVKIAGIHAERGETEKSRLALQRAKKAMAEMPDSSGMAKLMVVPGILASQIALGEIDSVRDSVSSLNPLFFQQLAPFLVKTFLENDDPNTAVFIAETLLKGEGAGGAEIISTFIQANRIQQARLLLGNVKIESHIGHVACRHVGSAMFQTGQTELLLEWLDELPQGVSAHLCIGAARTAGSYLLAPASRKEKALVSYITITDELPAGYALDRKPYPNPGVYRRTSLPELARSLQLHRIGREVRLFMTAKAVFVSEGQRDIHVFIYKLNDSATAARTVSEIYRKPFSDRYLQKGPYVIFVDAAHGPERIDSGDRIQAILNQRELPNVN